jgi:HTH-type transcriptional regulator/antitoxin HigA
MPNTAKERGKMATLTESAYGKLLSKVRPRVIKTEEENERAIAELEALDIRAAQGRPLTPEEEELGDLLTALILQFEAAHYPLGHAAPIDSLRS